MSEYWKQAEPGVTYKDYSVHVNNRMTEYESRRFKAKADRLLDVLDTHFRRNYNIERLVAYGHAKRIGAYMSIDNDPLNNGLIVGNFEDFEVEAVNPVDTDTVYIRFNYVGDLDV